MGCENSTNLNSLVDAIQLASNNGMHGITFIGSDDKDIYLSYTELYERAFAISNFYIRNAIRKGNEIIILVENNEKFLSLFWSCILIGIIPVPVTYGSNDNTFNKLLKIWNILKKPHLITNESTFHKLENFCISNDSLTLLNDIKNKVWKVETIFDTEKSNNANSVISNNNYTEIENNYIPEPSDIAFIQFSSGSTGDPKGIVLTHENIMTNIYAIINCAGFTKSDSFFSWMPLTHDMGLIGYHFIPLVCDIFQCIMPTSLFIRRSTLWFDRVNRYKSTILCSPNFGYRYFLDNYDKECSKSWDLSHVKLIFNGAEPISSQLCLEFLEVMKNYGLKSNVMFCVYGLAEATLAVCFPPPGEEIVSIHLDRRHIGIEDKVIEVIFCEQNRVTFVDVGYPVNDCLIKIASESGYELEECTVGHICIKGANVTSQYYNSEGSTKIKIRDDGWLNTGDLGFMRNGRLIITGRAKDIIFVNGQNYYSHDIEQVTQKVNGLEFGQVVAVGIQNLKSQKEELLLFVLYKKDLKAFVALAQNIKECLNKELGLNITAVLPIKKIPKTTSGKLQRYKLGQMYNNGEFSETLNKLRELIPNCFQSQVCDLNPIEEKLLCIWKKVLNNDNLSITDNFFDMGGNSIKVAQVGAYLENDFKFDIKESFNYLSNYPTIKELSSKLELNSTIS